MNRIEQLQNELRDYLISIMPVPWDRIVLYAKSTKSISTIRYAFREKETHMTITTEFWFDRYHEYQFDETEIAHILFEFTSKIYNSYLDEYGEDKIWLTMAFVIDEYGGFHTDYSYELPKRDMGEERNWLVETYFGDKYTQLKGYYPSVEVEFRAE